MNFELYQTIRIYLLETEIRRMSDIVSNRTIIRRSSHKNNIGTEIVTTVFAILASSARNTFVFIRYTSFQKIENRIRILNTKNKQLNTWFHGYSISFLKMFNIRTNINNDAGRFVTQNHRSIHDKVTDSTVSPIVNITSTNTNALDVNQNLFENISFNFISSMTEDLNTRTICFWFWDWSFFLHKN